MYRLCNYIYDNPRPALAPCFEGVRPNVFVFLVLFIRFSYVFQTLKAEPDVTKQVRITALRGMLRLAFVFLIFFWYVFVLLCFLYVFHTFFKQKVFICFSNES